MNVVEEQLRKTGPCLSTELARLLVDQQQLRPDAARQRISRQTTSVKRLAYLKFPRNARFIYLPEQYGSPRFWDALVKALLEHSPAYGGALAALRQRGSLIPKDHFVIACGSPLAQKKHLSPQLILERLTTAQLLEEINVPGVGPCVARAQEGIFYAELIPALQARLVVEDILLKGVRSWTRNLGLVSYDRTEIRGEGDGLPQVGTFAWDFTAPSYLGGLVERSPTGKPKPGFLVCDLVLGHEISAAGLAPFLRKCQTLRSLKKIGRCLQLFIADEYSQEAFQLAKSQGIIPGTPANLFGEQVAAALQQLALVLQQAAGVRDARVFNELFDGLGRIEGAANNLRGTLFEFWAGEVVRQLHGADIRLNRVFTDGENKAEVDVQASVVMREVRFYECKGYQPGGLVPDTEVTRWLVTQIPLIYKQAIDNPEWKGRRFHFEFWTTGRLSEEAVAAIEKAKKTVRPGRYTLDYCYADGLLPIVQETKDRALISALRQHFLNHPMAEIERKEARRLQLTANAARRLIDEPASTT